MLTCGLNTFSESLGLFRYHPMPGLDVHKAKSREELSDQWQNLVWNVLAARPTDEQRRLLKAHLVRVLVREVPEILERTAQSV